VAAAFIGGFGGRYFAKIITLLQILYQAMSILEIKLLLVKKIVSSEDKQLLTNLLQLLEHTDTNSTPVSTENENMIAMLLQDKAQQSTNSPTSQQDIDELQREVNELLGE
jgi:hypothetical protein